MTAAELHRIFSLVPWMRECGNTPIDVAGELVYQCSLQ
jgi:hypothetical protein